MTVLDPSAPGSVAGAVTFRRVVRSEWTKLHTVRSTWWSLGVTAVLAVGMGVLGSAAAAGDTTDSTGTGGHFDAAHQAAATQFGVLFASLVITVLGALAMTGEYGTGMIRSSLSAVPRRVTVLLAKSVVLFATVLALTGIAAVLAFGCGGLVFGALDRPGPSWTDPAAAVVVAGAPLYLAVAAVFALAVGTLVRNTAAAVTVLVGVFFVLPAVAGGAPVLRTLAPYLPSNAGGAASRQVLTGDPLPGSTGFALFCAYTVVLLLVAARWLRRRDV